MKVKDQIPQSIITAAVAMLSQFVPDISPTRLIAALQAYDSEGKEQEIINERPRQPLKISEVCQLLQISKPTLYRMATRGELTLLKIGSSTRVAVEEIERLLTQGN